MGLFGYGVKWSKRKILDSFENNFTVEYIKKNGPLILGSLDNFPLLFAYPKNDTFS